MVTRGLARVAAAALRALHRVLVFLAANVRTLVCVLGLVMLHVGLRSVEPWAPGVAWSVPGLIVVGVAIFGARGGAPPRRA
jgi:hypothetical protein